MKRSHFVQVLLLSISALTGFAACAGSNAADNPPESPASQSSTPSWGGNAGRAVDGNTNGNWYSNSVSHTDYNAQAWWQVDLGVVTNIGQVVVYNRTDCCSERLSSFDVLVSADGGDWQSLAFLPGPALPETAFTTNISGRFVRVALRGTDYLSLAEVEVHAP